MGNQATSGELAYKISLTKENFIGEGQYGDVYKIYSKDLSKVYAAKFLKMKPENMNSEEKMGYERELKVLEETTHPFII
jgi:serine/threonine protein kinase